MNYNMHLYSLARVKESPYDFFGLSDHRLWPLVNYESIIDVTEYYNKYGNNMMNETFLLTGTFDNKLYSISNNDPTFPQAIFYNVKLLEKLQEVDPTLKEPARIFNEKNWTLDSFKNYCIQVQNAMEKLYGDEGTAGHDNQKYYAISGYDSYWWAGLASNDGEPIVDIWNEKINVDSINKKEAADLVKFLFDHNYFDPKQGVDNEILSWVEGRSLFNVLDTSHIGKSNKWDTNLWGEDTRYGYVPWPRANDLGFDEIKIAINSNKYSYAMANYRDYSGYGEDCNAENIYWALSELLQRSKKYYDNEENMELQIVGSPYAHTLESMKADKYVKELLKNGNSYYDPLCSADNPIASLYTNGIDRMTVKSAITQYCATNQVETWEEAIKNLIPRLQESVFTYLNPKPMDDENN